MLSKTVHIFAMSTVIIFTFTFLSINKAIAEPRHTIAVIPKATLLHYWKIVCVGAHVATADSDVKIIWRGPRVENKVDAQKHLIDFYIDKRVDAIVIAPTHKEKLNKNIEKAVSKGIKVVIIDSLTSSEAPHSSITTDNYKAGKTGAKLLLNKITKKGPVILMGNTPDSSSIARRELGFIDAVNELSPGTTVIRVDMLEGTRKEAELSAQAILKNTPNVAGVFAVNEVSSEGVLRTLEKLKLHDIAFVGFDYSKKLVAGIQSGKVDALITQKPFAMGYIGVRTAMELLEGKTVSKQMESPIKIITADNINFLSHLRCLREFSEKEKTECPLCFN